MSLSEDTQTTEREATRTPWLLLAGAALGLGLASAGLLEAPQDPGRLPLDAAAIVGERTIRRIDYQRVLAGVAGDLRSPVDETMRKRVLDRMIDGYDNGNAHDKGDDNGARLLTTTLLA